jgi:hypothetical protein
VWPLPNLSALLFATELSPVYESFDEFMFLTVYLRYESLNASTNWAKTGLWSEILTKLFES